MSTQAEALKKNGAKAAPPPAAEGDGFRKVNLRRPIFAPAHCKGKVQGILLNVVQMPTPTKGPSAGKEWFVYIMKLTAPAQVQTGKDGNGQPTIATANTGDEIMVQCSGQLWELGRRYMNADKAFELRLTPGPNPPKGLPRDWEVEEGRVFDRGDRYPLITATAVKQFAAAAPARAEDDADESSEIPF